MERGGDEITEHDEITRKYSTTLMKKEKLMSTHKQRLDKHSFR